MPTERFNEKDRQYAVRIVENKLQVRLRSIGRWRKYFCDQRGKRYIILGGHGDWHGISKKIFLEEENGKVHNPSVTSLYVAKMYSDKMVIFSGLFESFVKNKTLLTLTENELYEFNFEPVSRGIKVREISGLVLDKFMEVQFP